ncbi:MMPL family transporter [Mumia sp. Pv 4-285]|uniref:MMPL family transporter n=1 Tax=Mumia qirimensis TaxID=3234852 RepID=UPI00351DA8B9
MFTRLGHVTVKHARTILLLTAILMVGATAAGVTVFTKLQTEGFTDPRAESSVAEQLIDERLGGTTNLVFVAEIPSDDMDSREVVGAGVELTESLRADPAIDEVTSWFETRSPALLSTDGRHALVLAHASDDSNETITDLRSRFSGDRGPFHITMGGAAAVGVDITEQVGKDLALAESIAVPLIMVLLLLAFRTVAAALVPLVIGGIAVLGTFAVLTVIGSVTDVSVFALNLTTALGLGLAVDYALLMVSRFREELGAGHSAPEAVRRCVSSAGRTIAFSAITVAAALAVLLVFPLYFLRSFAYAGVAVVLIAMAAALVVLPAALALLGPRIERGRLPWLAPPPPTSRFWGRVGGTAMRHPLATAAPVLALLLLAATPLLSVQFGMPDDRVLTSENDARVVGDLMREEFPANEATSLQAVLSGDLTDAELDDYAASVSQTSGVALVRSRAGVYVDGTVTDRTETPALGAEDTELLLIGADVHADSTDSQALVGDVRAVPSPAATDVYVGGASARLVDTKDTVGSRLPLAVGLITGMTLVLLFLFTGSVVQPVRALLLNAVSLSATLGLMVMVFQEGWFDQVLGFTARPLDLAMLVLLLCITFGLSMDYELFVISRIKELSDAGASLQESVSDGLARTGRIVTTAAALLAVNFFAFMTSGVSFIQMFGLGTGLAILIDATLVRGVLLPAAMRVTGRFTWWAPRPLRRLHRTVGVRER